MKHRIRSLAVLLVLLAVGSLVASTLVVYPETIATKSTWIRNGADSRWHYRPSRCSLVQVMRQGFTYEPMMMDARQVHTRSPAWRLNYLWIAPLCALGLGIVSWLLLLGLRRLPSALATLRRGGRWTKVACLYVSLSIVAHVLYLGVFAWFIHRRARIGLVALFDEFIVGPLELLTLPCAATNHAILYALNLLNGFSVSHTSPPLGLPWVQPLHAYGAYYPGGLLWESFCLLVIVAFWILVLALAVRIATSCRSAGAAREEEPTHPDDAAAAPKP